MIIHFYEFKRLLNSDLLPSCKDTKNLYQHFKNKKIGMEYKREFHSDFEVWVLI